MLEFIGGLVVGFVVAGAVGLLVWKNNKGKWGLVVDKLLALIDEYKDPEALKAAIISLLAPLRK